MDSLSPHAYKQQLLPFGDIPPKNQLNHNNSREEVSQIKLQDARKQLHLSIKMLAEASHLNVATVSSCEHGRVIHIDSANAILNTLNTYRKEHNMESLAFKDIDWKIRESWYTPEMREKILITKNKRINGETTGKGLRELRVQLGVTVKELASRAHVSPNTILAGEHGKAILPATAHTILDALNDMRKEDSMEPLALQDIDWLVQDWRSTPEGIAKMSERSRGERNPMYGKVGAMKGKRQPVEGVRKRAEARRGVPIALASRAKMSKAKKGKKQSEEAVRNNGMAQRGKKRTPEAKARYSAARIAYWKQFSRDEKAELTAHLVEKGAAFNPIQKRDTKPELAYEATLKAKDWQLGVDYEKQFKIGSCYVDFYIPGENLVVEIFGCWWHQCVLCGHTQGIQRKKRNKGIRTAESIHAHDKRRIEYIESKGYTVKVIWAHEFGLTVPNSRHPSEE